LHYNAKLIAFREERLQNTPLKAGRKPSIWIRNSARY